ncbi:FHA domain-containing protein [Herbaspirillum sp. HC18]|nr:FHA domain-containing protein [Herbaspirillum sp. HC18]
MARIILSIGDDILRDMVLSKERTAIGRRPHNDVVIDNLAISGEHAVIVNHHEGSFLEDLNSTNGTQVNGQPIKKHFLQDNDVIEMAQFRIVYKVEDADKKSAADISTDLRPSDQSWASIRVLTGPSAGREIQLNKAITTLGRANMEVAVVIRKGEFYFLAHVEGESRPMLNGHEIGSTPHQITDGDVINLSGTEMRLFIPKS